MKDFPQVFVLVQGGTIKARQTVDVSREARVHPLGNDAKARMVATIHKARKLTGCATFDDWRKHADGLVPPGSRVGMGGDRQQLDVCKIHLLHVGYKLIGQDRKSVV